MRKQIRERVDGGLRRAPLPYLTQRFDATSRLKHNMDKIKSAASFRLERDWQCDWQCERRRDSLASSRGPAPKPGVAGPQGSACARGHLSRSSRSSHLSGARQSHSSDRIVLIPAQTRRSARPRTSWRIVWKFARICANFTKLAAKMRPPLQLSERDANEPTQTQGSHSRHLPMTFNTHANRCRLIDLSGSALTPFWGSRFVRRECRDFVCKIVREWCTL